MYRNEIEKNLILLVDDVPRNLQVLSTALKGPNIEIAAALNGKQALEIIQKAKPDLILLDIMMPEISGFETMERLKSNEETADIPVIFLTARTESDDVIKGLEMGAVDYITKPFNHVELITRVRNHLELKNARDTLKLLNSSKDKLFSIISHDLRTPFAIIIGFAEYLIEHLPGMNEEQVLDLTQDILSTSQKAHNLFENLLQWACSQSNRIEFKPEQVDFKSLVNESIQLIYNRAREKGIEISVNIPENLIIKADKNMLDVVFRNLTTNAIKFTKSGGSINISANTNQNWLEASVVDTGVGIPRDVQKHLFRIDEHVSTTGTDQENGSGLGLILVKEFMEKHGGTIGVESKTGEGSRFHLRLPLN